MRRLLTSYLQSYSPFASPTGEVGPGPLMVALPVWDERTSIGVQTDTDVPPHSDPNPRPLRIKTPDPPSDPHAHARTTLPTPVYSEAGAEISVVQETQTQTQTQTQTLGVAHHHNHTHDEHTDTDTVEPGQMALGEPPIPTEAPVVEDPAGQDDAIGGTPADPSSSTEVGSEAPEVLSKDLTTPDTSESAPDGAAESEEQGIQRDEELWFEDGNLVLVAGNVEFRVYKGPLIARSGVFKDMLSLPQPESGASTSGSGSTSCATVHLSESPQDVRHFLRVFVEGTLRFEPTFDEISAYIRLGHKYQCEKLMQRSLDYLKKYYVDDFDQWFKVTSLDPPSFNAIHRIGVVNLARLAGADGILPVALMCCCMLGAEISDGFAREDGTRETLALDDLARCFVGRAKLLEATFVAAHKTFRSAVAEGCKDPERCAGALQRLLGEMIENAGMMKDIRDLRFDNSKSDYILSTDENRDLCNKCYTMIGKNGRQADQHREIFRQLPDMMGVKVAGWMAGEETTEDDTTV